MHGKMGCNLGIFAQGLEGGQPGDREVRAFGQIAGYLRELADPAQYGFGAFVSFDFPFSDSRTRVHSPKRSARLHTHYIQVTQGKVYTSTVPLTRNNHPIEIIQKRNFLDPDPVTLLQHPSS